MWLVVVLIIGNFFLFVGVADVWIFFWLRFFFFHFVVVGDVDSGGF